MTDVFAPDKRSAVMRAVKNRDTAPELAVRRILRAAGIGYRLGGRALPGRPDLVMPGRRVAVFVHGCFWHGHDCPRGARTPKPTPPTGPPRSAATGPATMQAARRSKPGAGG